MTTPDGTALHSWWNELRHGGMLISPVVLAERFQEGPVPLDAGWYARLRDRYTAFEAWVEAGGLDQSEAGPLHRWLDALFEEFLTIPADRWVKGPGVEGRYTATASSGERLRPQRVLLSDTGRSDALLFIILDKSRQVGQGRGRLAYARCLELLRATGNKLALLTGSSNAPACP